MARLLVSVTDADEARAAQSGGADIVDAKDPRAGALGALPEEALHAIGNALAPGTPLSIALGDATDLATTRTLARAAATRGALFVKLGFACIADASTVHAHLDAARGAARTASPAAGVVAVAYADADGLEAASAEGVLAAATSSAVDGVLLDTARKDAPALFDLWGCAAVRGWIERARGAGLLVAVAGRLDAAGVARASSLGADVVGVRGAACDGGRLGRVSEARVRALVAAAHA